MSTCTGLFQQCPTLCNPVDCGLPGFCQEGGFSRQEYWSVLANALQYSCLEKPLRDREAWQVTVHRVTESDTTEATL